MKSDRFFSKIIIVAGMSLVGVFLFACIYMQLIINHHRENRCPQCCYVGVYRTSTTVENAIWVGCPTINYFPLGKLVYKNGLPSDEEIRYVGD